MLDQFNLAEAVSISTKMHMWWVWMRVASTHVANARRAREGQAPATSFESIESSRLSAEFEASLVGIAAVAFAIDSLVLELESNGSPKPSEPPARADAAGHNRGDWTAQHLMQMFNFTPPFSTTLHDKLHRVFDLRNRSVHFKSLVHHGLHSHPSGQRTTEEMAVFTLEEAEWTLNVGREVIAQCAQAVSGAHVPAAATSIASELSGVLKMLDEVIGGTRT